MSNYLKSLPLDLQKTHWEILSTMTPFEQEEYLKMLDLQYLDRSRQQRKTSNNLKTGAKRTGLKSSLFKTFCFTNTDPLARSLTLSTEKSQSSHYTMSSTNMSDLETCRSSFTDDVPGETIKRFLLKQHRDGYLNLSQIKQVLPSIDVNPPRLSLAPSSSGSLSSGTSTNMSTDETETYDMISIKSV